MDICGGEPLLWPDLYDFCAKVGRPWAITSNLVSLAYRQFTEHPLPGGMSWTCTYHPEAPLSIGEWTRRANELRQCYPITIAVLNTHPAAQTLIDAFHSQGFHTALEPYEPKPALLPKPTFTCRGGQTFLSIDPDGECYPCVDSQRAGENGLGNIFRGTLKLPSAPIHCSLRCNTWHVLMPYHPSGDVHSVQVKRLGV